MKAKLNRKHIPHSKDQKWLDEIARSEALMSNWDYVISVVNNPNCSVETLTFLGDTELDYEGWTRHSDPDVLEHVWSNSRYPIGLLIGHAKNKDAGISDMAKRVLKTRNVLDDLLDD